MFGCIRKDLYLLFHKKAFLIVLIGITLLLSYMSLNGISSAYYAGRSYQNYFFMMLNYTKHAFMSFFFLLIPLLVVFPFADTWLHEQNMTDVIFTRVTKKQYFFSKYLISFISGFIVIFIPLVVSYCSVILALDFNDNVLNIVQATANETNTEAFFRNYTFYQIYLENPYLFIFMFLFLISIFGGFCAVTAFSISLVVKQKVIAYIGMFLFLIVEMLVIGNLPVPFGYYNIQNIIQPDTRIVIEPIVYIVWLGIFLILNIVLYYVFCRRTAYERA